MDLPLYNGGVKNNPLLTMEDDGEAGPGYDVTTPVSGGNSHSSGSGGGDGIGAVDGDGGYGGDGDAVTGAAAALLSTVANSRGGANDIGVIEKSASQGAFENRLFKPLSSMTGESSPTHTPVGSPQVRLRHSGPMGRLMGMLKGSGRDSSGSRGGGRAGDASPSPTPLERELDLPRLKKGKRAQYAVTMKLLTDVMSADEIEELPRDVYVVRGVTGVGFQLEPGSPVKIGEVRKGSSAELAGVLKGDLVLQIEGQPCSDLPHADVVSMMKAALAIQRITAKDREGYLDLPAVRLIREARSSPRGTPSPLTSRSASPATGKVMTATATASNTSVNSSVAGTIGAVSPTISTGSSPAILRKYAPTAAPTAATAATAASVSASTTTTAAAATTTTTTTDAEAIRQAMDAAPRSDVLKSIKSRAKAVHMDARAAHVAEMRDVADIDLARATPLSLHVTSAEDAILAYRVHVENERRLALANASAAIGGSVHALSHVPGVEYEAQKNAALLDDLFGPAGNQAKAPAAPALDAVGAGEEADAATMVTSDTEEATAAEAVGLGDSLDAVEEEIWDNGGVPPPATSSMAAPPPPVGSLDELFSSGAVGSSAAPPSSAMAADGGGLDKNPADLSAADALAALRRSAAPAPKREHHVAHAGANYGPEPEATWGSAVASVPLKAYARTLRSAAVATGTPYTSSQSSSTNVPAVVRGTETGMAGASAKRALAARAVDEALDAEATWRRKGSILKSSPLDPEPISPKPNRRVSWDPQLESSAPAANPAMRPSELRALTGEMRHSAEQRIIRPTRRHRGDPAVVSPPQKVSPASEQADDSVVLHIDDLAHLPAEYITVHGSHSEADPEPKPEPELELDLEPEPAPAPAPEPEPAPDPEPEPEPELEPKPELELEPEPKSELELEPTSEPELEPEPEPLASPKESYGFAAAFIEEEKHSGELYSKSSRVRRQLIVDDHSEWTTSWPAYDPPVYTSHDVLRAYQSDPESTQGIGFNTPSTHKGEPDRLSATGNYAVRNGVPLNPTGRSGLAGRGDLFHWGPNHCGYIMLTRWARHTGTEEPVEVDGKRVLEVLVASRGTVTSLPGGQLRPEGSESLDKIRSILRRVANENAEAEARSGMLLFRLKQQIEAHLGAGGGGGGKGIFNGVAMDPRNTDNAWVEATVTRYHSDNTTFHGLPRSFDLTLPGTGEFSCTWRTIYGGMHGVAGQLGDWIEGVVRTDGAYYGAKAPSYSAMGMPVRSELLAPPQAPIDPLIASVAARGEGDQQGVENETEVPLRRMSVSDMVKEFHRRSSTTEGNSATVRASPHDGDTDVPRPRADSGVLRRVNSSSSSSSSSNRRRHGSTSRRRRRSLTLSVLSVESIEEEPELVEKPAEEETEHEFEKATTASSATANAAADSESIPAWKREVQERRRRRQERERLSSTGEDNAASADEPEWKRVIRLRKLAKQQQKEEEEARAAAANPPNPPEPADAAAAPGRRFSQAALIAERMRNFQS
eukprot:UC1_evm3s216